MGVPLAYMPYLVEFMENKKKLRLHNKQPELHICNSSAYRRNTAATGPTPGPARQPAQPGPALARFQDRLDALGSQSVATRRPIHEVRVAPLIRIDDTGHQSLLGSVNAIDQLASVFGELKHFF